MVRGVVAVALAALALAAPAGASVSGWLTFGGDSSRAGFVEEGIADPASLREIWATKLDGRITTQVLVARNVPAPGNVTFYVGTSKGVLYALNENGFERARRQLGFMRLKNCEFLPDGEFGITGTPAIDPRTATLYLTDALGFAHALDLLTLEEREGWPIRLYKDSWIRLTWGAVTLVQGRLYVGTGELCHEDTSTGKLFAVDLHTRAVSVWTTTPQRFGGGGGIWGWGGVAYDRQTDSILAATSDAYHVGTNEGESYDPAAGFAAHLIQFDRRVRVRAAHSPFEPADRGDLDFSGTPIVLRTPGCPALVAAENKNGFIYVWRLKQLDAGLHDAIRIAGHLNGQPSWSPRTRSLYVGSNEKLFRLALTAKCRFRVAWSIPLGIESVNGPPTVAGDTVWFPATDTLAIWAVDARSGEVLWKGSMGEPVYTAPTVIDGRVYAGGFSGVVKAFG